MPHQVWGWGESHHLFPLTIQEDIQLRELKAFSTSIVQYLGTLATSHPESASTLNVLFSQVSGT